MNININIHSILSKEEITRLKRVFGCEDNELEEHLQKIAISAFYEYIEMILGKQMPTRAEEIKEKRLYLLVKHYFTGRIPSESEVSSFFQLTERGSSTLLRNVRTKYKFDLEKELNNTIVSILKKAENTNDGFRLEINSKNIEEELKQVVSNKSPGLHQITKVPKSAGLYIIPEDTFDLLCKNYNIDLNEIEAAAGGE